MMGLMQHVRRNRWFFLAVVVPTLLSMIYYGLIASDQYVSEARFVIKAPNQRGGQVSTIANLFQSTGLSAGQEQASEVMDYIRSRSAMQAVAKALPLEQLYARDGVDGLSRYPAPFVSRADENLFRYYSKMVSAELDHDSGVVVLKVRAFTPDDAAKIDEKLLTLSENLVNSLNQRAYAKGISEAETRVSRAQERVEQARLALRGYRNEEKLLDPAKQASGVLEVANRLETERATLSAQIDQMERAAPANPALPALRARMAAISREIGAQEGKAVGTSQGIASKLSGYEKRLVEQEFATQNLAAANAFLEQARSDAIRQQFYLERVVEPNTPDLPELPHRLRIILTVFVASLCLYFVIWMFVVGILEHAPED